MGHSDIVVRKDTSYDFSLFKYARTCFMTHASVLGKNVYYAAIKWEVLFLRTFVLKFKCNVFLLIFHLDSLFIVESGILKSPPTVVLSISPFRSLSICLIYFGVLMLGAYIFMIAISFVNNHFPQ